MVTQRLHVPRALHQWVVARQEMLSPDGGRQAGGGSQLQRLQNAII